MNDIHWRQQAACKDREDVSWFYGSANDLPMLGVAMTICNDCPVKAQCLSSAPEEDLEYGMRGGKFPLRAMQLLHHRALKIEKDRSSIAPELVPAVVAMLTKGKCRNRHKLSTVSDILVIKEPDGRLSARCRSCNKNSAKGVRKRAGRRVVRTHCINGHKYTEETTRLIMQKGALCRRCSICVQAAGERFRKRKSEESAKMGA